MTERRSLINLTTLQYIVPCLMSERYDDFYEWQLGNK